MKLNGIKQGSNYLIEKMFKVYIIKLHMSSTTIWLIFDLQQLIIIFFFLGMMVEKDLLSQTVRVWLCALILDGCKS